MSSLVLVFFALLSLGVNAEFKEENGVLVLTDADFSDAMAKYENIMVMFHAPWCGHCRAFKPAYEEAAQRLKDNAKIVLAKVDATDNKKVSEEHQITGYPTVKLFRQKESINYNAGRDADSVVAWILRKLEPPVKKLQTVADVKSFIDSENVTLIAFAESEDSALSSVLMKVADLDKAPVGLSSSSDVLKEYGVDSKAKVVLFRKFDEPRVDFDGELTSEAIERFLMTETIPLVVDFNSQSVKDVFSSPITKHFIYFAKRPDSYDTSKEMLLPLAKRFKGKVHFVLIDVSDSENARVLEFFGLSDSDVPIYRFIEMGDDMVKYKPETSDLSENAIGTFVGGILSKTIKPYLMSQDIPPESDSPVKILVGKNYNEFVQNPSKAVFAYLYAPWCGHCKQFTPIWEELGKAYHDREDIAIVKMDATSNEAEGLQVRSFPTLKYYGMNTDKVVEYKGERTLEAFKKFLESGGKEVKEEEEDEKAKEEEKSAEKRDEL